MSEPNSLAELLGAAPATPAETPVAAAPAEAVTPSNDAAATTTDTSAASTTTPDTSGVQVTDPNAATVTPAAGTADPNAAATPPAEIDWGSAMPALVAKAKAIGVKDGVIAKFGNDIEGLLRSIDERETQVGELSGYKGAFNALAESGVRIEELQALQAGDLQRLNALLTQRLGPRAAAQMTNAAAAAQANNNALITWSKSLLAGVDAQGNPIFNQMELAKRGMTEQQAAVARNAWLAQLAQDKFADEDSFREYVTSIVAPQLGQAAQQTELKLTAAQQQALAQQQQQQQIEQAQQQYVAEVSNWAAQNAKLLYANQKGISGGASAFYQQMEKVATELGLPRNMTVQQLETVKNLVLAQNRPTAAAPTPSAKANRQPQTGAQPKQLSPEEFYQKFNHLFGNRSGVKEYVNYLAEGKVPQ